MPLPPDADQIRVRLVHTAEYLHHLWRVQENSEPDLSNEINEWQKIVDGYARELVAALNLEISPSEAQSGSSNTK